LAAHAWPDASPLDRLFKWGPVAGRVAGVVNMGFGSIRLGRPYMFMTFDLAQHLPAVLQSQPLQLVVRAEQPDRLREDIRQLAARAFPDATSMTVVSGRELVNSDLGQERLGASFLSAIGAAAWVLGIASLFGLVGYVVERRRREFGIMAALGASRTRLLWLAAREGLGPALAGGLVGVVGAIALARTVETFLLGIAGVDVATYAGAVALFAIVAAMASIVAASRTRYVRPSEALRGE
jgi:ABC-type antimicrobial peptide transport system permease subunit